MNEKPPNLKSGDLELKELLEMNTADWVKFHHYFKDREIATLNGSSPICLPLWLFKRLVIDEEKSGERLGFGIYLSGEFIGSVEFYDFEPPLPANQNSVTAGKAVLGILIGERNLWGSGYGTTALNLALSFIFVKKGFGQVTLRTLENNLRARRSFEKVGFQFTALSNNTRNKFANYSLFREQWLALNNTKP